MTRTDPVIGSRRAAGILVAIACLAYLPVLRSGFIWDDDAYVTENGSLLDFEELKRTWCETDSNPRYYPIVFTSYWIEYRIWGLNPAGYHAANVLLHALNGVLLWRLLVALGLPGAWLAAALFALHPVHVESVAWVSERKNVLSGFFYLSAALAYLRFAAPAIRRTALGKWSLNAASLALFICALLSKTVTATLPAALLLVLWWKQSGDLRKHALLLSPMFGLSVMFGLITVRLEVEHVGARGAEWDLSLIERCLIAGRATWFYLGKLTFPVNLAFIDPRWEIDAAIWWQHLFPLATAGVLIALWSLRGRIGTGPLSITSTPAADSEPVRLQHVESIQFHQGVPACYGTPFRSDYPDLIDRLHFRTG